MSTFKYSYFAGITFLILLTILQGCDSVRYQPNWESIDSRPLPDWYDYSKLGIFVHWGVFSVPSVNNEWFWYRWKHDNNTEIVNYMDQNFKPDFTYADFAKDFTAEFFNPNDWAKLFGKSGAKYVVLTSKHHEGFTNWPSKYAFSWNAMAVGPKRDLVGEFATAIRANTDIHFGLYHSRFEWYNPLYLNDKANGFRTQDFVRSKTLPELYEIVNAYKPEVIWSDGDWEAHDTYWNSTEFISWLYNDSPVKDVVVTNDRWGMNVTCHHGGFLTCMDRYNPGQKQSRKFENAMTIDKKSWGYRRNAPLEDYLTMEELLKTFIETVSCGGNMLMNVGPTKSGMIAPIFQERLTQLGQWMGVNGEGIYGSHPWTYQNDTINSDVWYTMKANSAGGNDVYAFLTREWPNSPTLTLGGPAVTANTKINLVGTNQTLAYKSLGNQGVTITLPVLSFAEVPCMWAWAFKLTNLSN